MWKTVLTFPSGPRVTLNPSFRDDRHHQWIWSWNVKELLIIIGIVVLGTQLVRTYDAMEEPVASKALRLSAAEFPDRK